MRREEPALGQAPLVDRRRVAKSRLTNETLGGEMVSQEAKSEEHISMIRHKMKITASRIKPSRTLLQAMRRYIDPLGIIKESLEINIEAMKELEIIRNNIENTPNDQSLRRIFIRSLISGLEAFCFRLKQDATCFNRFSNSEMQFIDEVAYRLQDNGSIQERNLRLPPDTNLNFSFEIISQTLNIDFRPDNSDVGWNNVLHSIILRNRITHPKGISDLEVTDNEITRALNAARWYVSTIQRVYKAIFKRKPPEAPGAGPGPGPQS